MRSPSKRNVVKYGTFSRCTFTHCSSENKRHLLRRKAHVFQVPFYERLLAQITAMNKNSLSWGEFHWRIDEMNCQIYRKRALLF